MRRVVAVRDRLALLLSCVSGALALGSLAAPPAMALEAVEGRVQAHGYFEMQLRTASKNYSEEWDVTQWYNIFALELEADLVQDRHGPLDMVSSFVRLEARFDCVYSRGCGMVSPINAFGDRSEELPGRFNRGDKFTAAGQILVSNDGPFADPDRDPLRMEQIAGFEGIYENNEEGPGRVALTNMLQCKASYDCNEGTQLNGVPLYLETAVSPRLWGADRNADPRTRGAPFLVTMEAFQDFRFGQIPIIGGASSGHNNSILGPWLPENRVELNATMANVPNPLDRSRLQPQSLAPGAGSNPMRPIPILREDDSERYQVWVRDERLGPLPPLATTDPNPTAHWETLNPLASDARTHNDRAALPWEARGIFTPSSRLQSALQEGKFDHYDFNLSESERAFNHGSSQQDEGELKEAYLDIEMFDSRLWMRVGKQSIVWGKTELFRTTDQFNPQDFALANLPSLEESRIGLWAWRGVYSFYDVGPLQDLRTELAFNFDQHESADLGACGEPYTINLVCSITFGSFAHGFTGIGVAGFDKPEDPWEDIQGLEVGGRVEFRWDRYSFAFSDFYGYNDFPNPVRLSSYSRNVDWRSGRPRHYMHTEADLALSYAGAGNPCATPSGQGVAFGSDPGGTRVTFGDTDETGCLYPGPTSRKINSSDGTFYRVPSNAIGQRLYLQLYRNQYQNNTSRADAWDPRMCRDLPGGCVASNPGYDPRFDPATGLFDPQTNRNINAYDPSLYYDPRNALDLSSTNSSLFNVVCATTVGFSVLDPTACALTVFSSTRPASQKFDTRVAAVISRIVAGDPLFNSALSEADSDEELNKGPLMPKVAYADQNIPANLNGMGMPIVALHTDFDRSGSESSNPNGPIRTFDARRSWAASRGVANPFIYSRENESYNCLPPDFISVFKTESVPVMCGGLAWEFRVPNSPGWRARSALSMAVSPEQEALLGCGPFYGTNCEANGIDLLHAEASSALQSFLGNDSLGISIAQLGIADLVPEAYGDTLMDGNSPSWEYRTDGRVVGIGFDGQPRLIRTDLNGDPIAGNAEVRDLYRHPVSGAWAVYGDYFSVKGIMPGTATFENLRLGGPKCTTADIGGPQGDAGILPGCRNKWATVRYSSSASATELDPNNRLAGYNGNNYGRTDYRQLDLSTENCLLGSPTTPSQNWDCYAHSPLDESVPLEQRSGLNWGVFDPAATGCTGSNLVNNPDCYLGGWKQGIDGDPDPAGVLEIFGVLFPKKETGQLFGDHYVGVGCTPLALAEKMNVTLDGRKIGPPRCAPVKTGVGAGHPFTGESFSTELAGLSWNFMMLLVAFSDDFQDGMVSVDSFVVPNEYTGTITAEADVDRAGLLMRDPSLLKVTDLFALTGSSSQAGTDINTLRATIKWDYAFTGTDNELMEMIPYCENLRVRQRRPTQLEKFPEAQIDCNQGGRTLGRERCTFVTPQYCDLVQAIFSVGGQKRNILRAGGNGNFGRRTMQWQSGGEIYLAYEKRNVLGFSMDFAEDRTKSSWGIEFTWIEGVPQIDNDSYEGTTDTDDFNLTVSMDRPTFVNFINPNHTLFINSQWFFQYRDGYTSGMPAKGPFNVLGTFTVFTGYFQDRLNPSVTFVYDVQSSSGAVLPQVSYRFSEVFSITVGASIFAGGQDLVDMPVNGVAPAAPRAGRSPYQDSSEPGVSLIRDRDEVFMILRYTF